jgi:hypothetical protein
MLLPRVLVLLGLPFGKANAYTGGDDLLPVAVIAIFPALASVLLMLLAAAARTLYERHRHSARPTAA